MHPSVLAKVFLALLAAVSPAAAELSVTAPIATTTCVGGQVCNVAWSDNGRGVTIAEQGNCTIALYTGNAQQQTFLQPIAFPTAVNVATTAAIEFVVDPSIGPNGGDYFIRFSSETLRNPSSATNPYLSFSAKFTLSGMTGTFNSTVESQLAGVTTAGSGGATATGATTTGSGTRTTSGRTTTPTASATGRNTNSTGSGAASPRFGVSSGSAGVIALASAVLAGAASFL